MRSYFILFVVCFSACGAADPGDSEVDGCAGGILATYVDADSDGYGDDGTLLEVCGELPMGRVLLSGDCDDGDGDLTPGRVERCDGIDNNCDGRVDEYVSTEIFYEDVDEDGFGDARSTVENCRLPAGFVRDNRDCDDANTEISPAITEVCDGIDNDCNGLIDDQDPDTDTGFMTLWYHDVDNDGFGAVGELRCSGAPGFVDNDSDCNDADSSQSPAATEVCGGGRVDENCDGLIDDADPNLDLASAFVWFADSDGDGTGDPLVTLTACRRPVDYVANDGDCDDSNPAYLGPADWYADADGDGYGSGPPVEFAVCVPIDSMLAHESAVDCDDGDPNVNPAEFDVCFDGVDSDCDGDDCVGDWFEDFESGVLGPEWTLTGNAQWQPFTGGAYEGATAARNGDINDYDVSAMTVNLLYNQPGSLSFWHSGSTEVNYDFLNVYIDGILVVERAGIWGWEQYSQPMATGLHSVEFEYAKDLSVSSGADTVYIDFIEAFGGTPQ